MDINLKVKLEAPELMAALLAVAEELPKLQMGNRLIQDNGVQAEEIKTVTLEQVRERLAALSDLGKSAQIKELMKKFGARKLSEVAEENYEALLREAEGAYLS